MDRKCQERPVCLQAGFECHVGVKNPGCKHRRAFRLHLASQRLSGLAQVRSIRKSADIGGDLAENCAMSLSISTVIPTFNVAEHLAQAIESVLAQTRQPIEVIVVDDCSTDGTIEIARSFKDPRVKVLSTPTNSGSATARNIAMRAATGDLIAMLDGDDYWFGDHLAVVAGLLDQHPEAALAFSPTEAFGLQNWVWPIRIPTDRAVRCFWDCVPRTIIPHMNVVIRRPCLMEIGGYREVLLQSQDYDLFMRLAYQHPFVCTQQVTSRYRRHDGSISVRSPHNSLSCMYRARHLLAQELAETARSEAQKQDLQRFEGICRELWVTALENCVIRRNWRLMDFHLGQAKYVPGADAELLRWKLRRAIGTVQWVWDYANRRMRLPLPDSKADLPGAKDVAA
jgi:cellulose synthase/poly-beta-1,6-N-acetylglucosamine synthase-like glycosyltransferase